MFGFKVVKNSVDFKECPMYNKSHLNGTKLSDLEANIQALDNDVNTLTVEQSVTMQSHIQMKNDVITLMNSVKIMNEGLAAHMDDEAEHHSNTNITLDKLTEVVNTLLTTQNEYRQQREKIEEAKALAIEEREAEANKVRSEIRSAVIKYGIPIIFTIVSAIGYYVYESVAFYTEAKITQKLQNKILGIEESK